MTSVTTNLNNSYYNLSGSSSNQSQTNKTGTVPSLADYLGTSKTADSKTSADSAYSLNLSPEAQNYLNGSAGSSASSFASANGFQLSEKQKQTIQSILEKYKDAPYTQETYQKIQDDLDKAGLSPQKLALEDNAKNFSTTKVLIAALSGQSSDTSTSASSIQADEKTNGDKYMQYIMKQWKSLSTTVSGTEAS